VKEQKMKSGVAVFTFLITLFILPGLTKAQQLWSGVLSPARATDWTTAGVTGGIRSSSWTQCGSTVPTGSSAAAINAAIAACGQNQYVLLAPGTYNLSAAITFAGKSNVVLRGSGANSTFLVFASGVRNACGGFGTNICVGNAGSQYWGSYTNIGWTAGFSQGATSITLGSTSGISTNSTIVVVNQCDDGRTGSSCTGTSIDTAGFYNCSDTYTTVPSGCSFNGPDTGNGTAFRYQQEMFQVTSVNSSTGVVTLSHPLRNPNWRSGQSPQAWIIQPSLYDGVEDLSIDTTSNTTAGSAIMFWSTANSWVKGVRFVRSPSAAVYVLNSVHDQIESSYFGLTNQPPSADSVAFRFTAASDNLVQNNIVHQVRDPYFCEGPCNGNVAAYNYILNDSWATQNSLFQSFRPHAGGNSYELDEGNVAMNIYWENYHGTQNMETAYRNFLQGWYSNPTSPKNYQANPLMIDAFNRYHNLVANVLGTPGVHTGYQQISGTPATNPLVIYAIGLGNSAVSPIVPSDPLGATTLLRWGNYDVVTNGVHWCGDVTSTGFVTMCSGISEVPAALPLYPNSMPTKGDTGGGQAALPPSFYLKSAPSWWGSQPFPAIGPEVSGGNVGICSGTLNVAGHYAGEAALSGSQCTGTLLSPSAWGGHVNAIPAMACALNIMGMPPDGSGGVLAFDAKNCYGSSTVSQGPAPPTNLVLTVITN